MINHPDLGDAYQGIILAGRTSNDVKWRQWKSVFFASRVMTHEVGDDGGSDDEA